MAEQNSYKDAIRVQQRQLRKGLTAKEVQDFSQKICASVSVFPSFVAAETVMIYSPIHHEVDLMPLITTFSDKKFLLPVVQSETEMVACCYTKPLKKGKFGILEPQSEPFSDHIDMILVPGLAFDKNGNRIGQGGGFYDRFLKKHPASLKIGVCYDFQVINNIKSTDFDEKMDGIITPSATYLL